MQVEATPSFVTGRIQMVDRREQTPYLGEDGNAVS